MRRVLLRILSIGATVLLLAMVFGAGIVAGIVNSYSRNLPDISRMADYQPSRTTRVYARDGTLLASLYQREPHLGADYEDPADRTRRVRRDRGP